MCLLIWHTLLDERHRYRRIKREGERGRDRERAYVFGGNTKMKN